MAAPKQVILTTADGNVKPVIDLGATGLLDTATDTMVADVRGLSNITIQTIQVTDAGTATINLEGTQDGTTWSTLVTALTEASFPAGNNTAVSTGLSNSAGLSLSFMQVRARLSAVTGGGTYKMSVSGVQLDTYR